MVWKVVNWLDEEWGRRWWMLKGRSKFDSFRHLEMLDVYWDLNCVSRFGISQSLLGYLMREVFNGSVFEPEPPELHSSPSPKCIMGRSLAHHVLRQSGPARRQMDDGQSWPVFSGRGQGVFLTSKKQLGPFHQEGNKWIGLSDAIMHRIITALPGVKVVRSLLAGSWMAARARGKWTWDKQLLSWADLFICFFPQDLGKVARLDKFFWCWDFFLL